MGMELRLLLGPDLLERAHLLLETLEACRVHRAVMLHLLRVPASADAELEPPAREEIEAGHLLGEGDGVALDDQADTRADPEARGGRGGRHGADQYAQMTGHALTQITGVEFELSRDISGEPAEVGGGKARVEGHQALACHRRPPRHFG